VQVDPIKPTLRSPGTKRLKLKCDEPPSNFAFNINMRRYNEAQARAAAYEVNGRNFESRCIEVGLGGSDPRFLS